MTLVAFQLNMAVVMIIRLKMLMGHVGFKVVNPLLLDAAPMVILKKVLTIIVKVLSIAEMPMTLNLDAATMILLLKKVKKILVVEFPLLVAVQMEKMLK